MVYDYTYYYTSLTIIYLLIVLATYVCINNWHHLKKTKEWIFLPFFGFTIIIEIISEYYVEVLNSSPAYLLDIYTLLSIIFAIYWFYSYLKLKALASISIIIVVVSYLLNLYDVSIYNNELPTLAIASALIITVNVFIFFNQILLKNNINKFKLHRPFWIALGLFVWHINSMPFVLFLPNLNRLTWQVSGVLVFINVIMYGCFIYGLRIKQTYDD